MFEHIYFLHNSARTSFQDIQQLDDYRQFVEEHDLVVPKDQDYYLDGETSYLLQHPLLPEHQENLIYLQGYSYTCSGASYYTRRKSYDSYLILYTYEGSGILNYNNCSFCLRPGDGFLIDCRAQHLYQTDGDRWLHGDLHFYGGISDFFYRENFSAKSPLFHVPDQSTFHNQIEKLLRIQSSTSVYRDFQFSFELERLLFYLIECQDVSPANQIIPEHIHLLQRYLEQNFASDISLDTMAHMTSMDKYYLCKQFKKHTGFAPKEYITHLRLLYARNLLQQTKLPGYQIGGLAGFPSEAAFLSQFKKAFGMTPGEFRKQMG